jgi:hypothetical protein
LLGDWLFGHQNPPITRCNNNEINWSFRAKRGISVSAGKHLDSSLRSE